MVHLIVHLGWLWICKEPEKSKFQGSTITYGYCPESSTVIWLAFVFKKKEFVNKKVGNQKIKSVLVTSVSKVDNAAFTR